MGCILSKAEVATTKAEVTTTTKAGGTRVAVTEPPVTPVAVPWYEVAVDLSNPVVRKSAHDLTEAEGDRVVAAWRKMTENKKGVPGSSEYFRLGVVHGGTQDRGTWLSEAQNPTPSYCVHGPECFANWHRIYITDMELTLRRADLALGNDGRIGLPYFDWTVKPAGKPMLPMVLQKIMATDSFEGKFSEGGLFHDTFLPLDRSGNQMAPRERDGTLFYKTTKWSPTLDAELRGLLVPAGLLVATMDVLRQANHRSAARTLESNPHGSVHVAVGMVGNKVPGTEMVGSVPTAGFHPIFWMHHCNVDRVYESCLATDLGKTFEEEFRGRLQGGGGSSPTNAFPGGEWGRFEPFGINPRTGEQYHCRDTFDTVGLGFKYDSLYKLPGTEGSLELMREKPLVCVFRDVEKSCVNGSKALFVYVSGCAEGSWTMPIDLAALDPTQLRALPNYAGFASLFVFSESAKCDNCVHNSPKVDVHLDVTAAVRALCLARAKTTLHVIAYDLCTKACMTLEQAGVPQPILMGPSIENHLAEDTEHTDDVTTLQHLLNDDKEGTPLKVDGKFGPLMTDAVKRAQCAAGLEPTGVFDGQLRSALHNKLSSLWHKVTGEDQPCAPVLVPKAGTVIRWRLVEGSVPPSIGTKAAVAAELAVAFAEWDAAMDGVTFERVVAADDAQMTIRFEDHTPHNKLIFDGPGGALAAVTPDTITFDSAERWELMDCKHSQRGCVPDEYFFKLLPVAVHEIGHLFGLGHSSEPGDVMSPFYNKVTKLSANDKARVAALLQEANHGA